MKTVQDIKFPTTAAEFIAFQEGGMSPYTTLPTVLDSGYRRKAPATLEELEGIIRTEARIILPVAGDCLEGAGVEDGGWVAVDFTRFPAPPRYKSKGGDGSADLCLCYAVFPGQRRPMVMCKEYTGVWGPWQMVGTRYQSMWDGDRFRPNLGMRAERVFGVIFAAWDRAGRLLWERDPLTFPNKLGTAPTIHGSNVGDPRPIDASDAQRLLSRVGGRL